ncbi:MAG: hypothetical protein ABEK03_09090 [Candidatus Bipolaricaulia bacterium]
MTQAINLVLLGAGGVGRALLGQIVAGRERHADQLGVAFNVVAVTDSDGLAFDASGWSDDEVKSVIEAKANGACLQDGPNGRPWNGDDAILDDVPMPAIVVDVTATDATVPLLLDARERDWGIVLANKIPLAGPFETFQALTRSRRTRFETTVAAALPVLSTLQTYLLDTGDRVTSARGCVSGTLNVVCRRLEAGETLSEVVADARAHGHTEPDPREDLAGRDAARKALILARLMGHRLEFDDVEVEPLYPSEMDDLDVDDFMDRLPELDIPYKELTKEALAAGRSLRYIIEVTPEGGRARLEQLEPHDELLRPGASDSVVALASERYCENSLIVRGMGSGPELTASGVLADLLNLAAQMA